MGTLLTLIADAVRQALGAPAARPPNALVRLPDGHSVFIGDTGMGASVERGQKPAKPNVFTA
jgi:hypothetical protein